jgi:uncharacterized protein YpuA (DUF1002 family)
MYQINEKVICEQIDNDVVAFDSAKECFYEFDEVAGFILCELNEHEKDIREIVQSVCNEYNVDEKTALMDIVAFVKEMENKGLLISIGENND